MIGLFSNSEKSEANKREKEKMISSFFICVGKPIGPQIKFFPRCKNGGLLTNSKLYIEYSYLLQIHSKEFLKDEANII